MEEVGTTSVNSPVVLCGSLPLLSYFLPTEKFPFTIGPRAKTNSQLLAKPMLLDFRVYFGKMPSSGNYAVGIVGIFLN